MPPSGPVPGYAPSLLRGSRPTPPLGSVGTYPEETSTILGLASTRPRASRNCTIGVPRSAQRALPLSVKIKYIIPLLRLLKPLPTRTSSSEAVHGGPTAGSQGAGAGVPNGVGIADGMGVGSGVTSGVAMSVGREGGVTPTVARLRSSRVVVRTPASTTTVATAIASPPTQGVPRDRESSMTGGSTVSRPRNPRRSRSSSISVTLITHDNAEIGKRATEMTAHRASAAVENRPNLVEREAMTEVERDDRALTWAQLRNRGAQLSVPMHDRHECRCIGEGHVEPVRDGSASPRVHRRARRDRRQPRPPLGDIPDLRPAAERVRPRRLVRVLGIMDVRRDRQRQPVHLRSIPCNGFFDVITSRGRSLDEPHGRHVYSV